MAKDAQEELAEGGESSAFTAGADSGGVVGHDSGAADAPAWSAEGTNAEAGLFLDAFFAQLGALGVRDVVVSPGSRSTPLAMKAYEHFGDVFLDVDERGAGFVALGMAKASGHPVAVVATSGSAIGNWMPAVLEAESSNVPVLFLSSDRPARLQGVGAPQTTDQVELFGGHARLFRQMPDPNILGREAGEGWSQVLGEAGAQAARDAVHAASGFAGEPADGGSLAGRASEGCDASIPGPVHLNFPFDEPLKPAPRANLPAKVEQGTVPCSTCTPELEQGTVPCSSFPDPKVARGILEAVQGMRTVIVAGEGAAATRDEALAIARAAEALGMPICADPLSGLRIPEAATAVANYDSICTRPGQPPIEAVIRLGRWPVSKRLALAVMDARPLHISVDRHEPLDFTATSDFDLRANPAALLEALAEAAPQVRASGRAGLRAPEDEEQASCLRQWREAEAAAEARIAAVRTDGGPSFEGSYVRALLDAIPAGSLLWAANSMSIRALDTFMFRQDLQVLANRGLNGIDGTTSSFLGAAFARAKAGIGGGAATFLTGDLTLLHDINALALAPELARHAPEAAFVIVCLNNAGGAIFDMLPQRSPDSYFERLFLTPQAVDFAGAATLFGIGYERPTSIDAFAGAYAQALGRPGITLIDVPLPLAGMPERYARYW